MKKYACLGLIILVCLVYVGVYLSQDYIAQRLLQNYLSGFLGEPFRYERLISENQKLVYLQPVLPLGPGTELIAEKAEVKYTIDWRKRSIDAQIHLIHPVLKISDQFTGWNPPAHLGITSWIPLTPHARLSSDQGELVFSNNPNHPLGFELEAGVDKKIEISALFTVGASAWTLELNGRTLKRLAGELHHFNANDFAAIKPLAAVVIPLMKHVDFFSGELDGEISYGQNLSADLTLKDGGVSLHSGATTLQHVNGQIRIHENHILEPTQFQFLSHHGEMKVAITRQHGSIPFPAITALEMGEAELQFDPFSISLNEGRFYDAFSGVVLEDLQTVLTPAEQGIAFKRADGFFQGFHFYGQVFIKPLKDDPEALEMNLVSDAITGTFSELKDFIAKYHPDHLLLKVPLEGEISLTTSGNQLQMICKQGACEIKAAVQGSLSEGTLNLGAHDASLHDISLNFDYAFPQDQLTITDLQGTLLLGSADGAEEYTVNGEKIELPSPQQRRGAFDVWLGDRNRDVVRAAGILEMDPEARVLQVVFDPQLTHIGSIQPKRFSLTVEDVQLGALVFHAGFDLNGLTYDLKRLSRSGLITIPESVFAQLNHAQGRFQLDLTYRSGRDHVWEYVLTGERLNFGAQPFQKLSTSGKIGSGQWIVEAFDLDDLSFSSEMEYGQGELKIPYMGVRLGKSLKMGLSGNYHQRTHHLRAQINLLDIHLDNLQEIAGLQKMADGLSVKGWMHGKGKLDLDLFQGSNGWIASADLQGSLQGLELAGYAVDEHEEVQCHYSSERGVTLTFKGSGLKFNQLVLQQAEYLIPSDQLNFTGHYRLPGNPIQITGVARQGGKTGEFHFLAQQATFLNVPVRWKRVSDGSYSFISQKATIYETTIQELAGTLKLNRNDGVLTIQRIDARLPSAYFSSEQLEHLKAVGITPQALIPVAGSIHYKMNGDKIVITKLKDVHTENKLLRYILPKSSQGVIDLSGSLDLTIGVQPYNLIFKGTDVFTFSIAGSLSHPSITMHKK
jgi:hypothetical protein